MSDNKDSVGAEHSAHYEAPEGIHGTHYGAKPGSGWSTGQIKIQYTGGIVATGVPQFEKFSLLESHDTIATSSAEKKLTFCDKCGEMKVKGEAHECYYKPECHETI